MGQVPAGGWWSGSSALFPWVPAPDPPLTFVGIRGGPAMPALATVAVATCSGAVRNPLEVVAGGWCRDLEWSLREGGLLGGAVSARSLLAAF